MEYFPDDVKGAGGSAADIASLLRFVHWEDLTLLVVVLALGSDLGRAFYWFLWERKPVRQGNP
jgi:hypothetical protein